MITAQRKRANEIWAIVAAPSEAGLGPFVATAPTIAAAPPRTRTVAAARDIPSVGRSAIRASTAIARRAEALQAAHAATFAAGEAGIVSRSRYQSVRPAMITVPTRSRAYWLRGRGRALLAFRNNSTAAPSSPKGSRFVIAATSPVTTMKGRSDASQTRSDTARNRPAIAMRPHGSRSRLANRVSRASIKAMMPMATPVGISQSSDDGEWPLVCRPDAIARDT